MAVVVAFLCFIPVAAVCFARLPLRAAILLVMIGGWWLLPVGQYPREASGTSFPWWITGIMLPSNMLLTKAWIPPLGAFIGAALRDWVTLRAWRPTAIDAPMFAWCLWPMVCAGGAADPAPWLAALYLSGSWGLPWLIGRIWFADHDSNLILTRALALSGLANLPVAIVEGVRPPMLYGIVYGPHPFRLDGIVRYIGYRPIGFLENGNLYGLWAAIAAFASLWLVINNRFLHRFWIALAAVNTLVALAAQSVGALLLLLSGLGLLVIWRRRIFLPLAIGVSLIFLAGTALHLTRVVPLQTIARTPTGEHVVAAMRAIGRGSFLWRLSQDTKTLASVALHPLFGSAHWDWWRQYGTRPWGQALLLIGQYGLVGLLFAWGSLIGACVAATTRSRNLDSRILGNEAIALVIIVLIALADATLNAFFFSPAILAGGAIAALPARKRHLFEANPNNDAPPDPYEIIAPQA